jgi:hypothetical protein
MAKTNNGMTTTVPSERVMQAILLVRGEKVMLDADLAKLYRVDTKVLLQAVKRNIERFPRDFMFQLSQQEFKILRSQFVTSSQWGGRRYPPYAFTEQGVAILSSVLRSRRAVLVNIEIVRAFVRRRQILASHADLSRKLDALEKKYDAQFKVVFDAIRELMTPTVFGSLKSSGRHSPNDSIQVPAIWTSSLSFPRSSPVSTPMRISACWRDCGSCLGVMLTWS